MTTGSIAGPDGRLRCPWGVSTPDYRAYHDEEWGRTIRDDNGLFERLTLESFQSGLSWLTILRKRESFRAAFAYFDVAAIARFDDADRERLMADAGIVRNAAKISAAVTNARAALAVTEGLGTLLWGFAPQPGPAPSAVADVPARTAASTSLAKELKRRGFVFIGPTTAYALMQAVGMVNDHLEDCFVRPRVTAEKAALT